MTVKEVATELDLSLWAVWKLCTDGVIASWKVNGRILMHPDDVYAYARNYRAAA